MKQLNDTVIVKYYDLDRKNTPKKMKRILISGVTGNIGFATLKYLYKLGTQNKIVAGVRNIDRAKQELNAFKELELVSFDIVNPDTFKNALKNVDTLFLLRPPQISDIPRYFVPLINAIKEANVKEVVFLSVQGAEKSSIIPHNKIEKLILDSGFDYVILRPSYFMQNLTTMLYPDIKNKHKIILPAGAAKFNWVDVENIGEVAAIMLNEFEKYKNQTFEITGSENIDFAEVVRRINAITGAGIVFENPNPIKYYRLKRKEGMDNGMAMVMIVLHFLPRFQKEPRISEAYEILTGNKPTTIEQFIEREKAKFV